MGLAEVVAEVEPRVEQVIEVVRGSSSECSHHEEHRSYASRSRLGIACKVSLGNLRGVEGSSSARTERNSVGTSLECNRREVVDNLEDKAWPRSPREAACKPFRSNHREV